MNAETLLKGLLYFILKAKYLKREKRNNRWKYWYKPESQRGAHEFTKQKFEKKTGLTDSTHKDSVERILQNSGHVNLRILRDYPDLAKKYNQGHRIEMADKIRARVKEKSSQVPNSKPDDKGREEKKPMKLLKMKELKLNGSDKQIKYAKDLINLKFFFNTFKEKQTVDYVISELSKQAIVLKEAKNGSVDAKYVIDNSTPRNSFIADFALEYPKFHEFVLSKTESERSKKEIQHFHDEKYKVYAGSVAKESYTDHAENAIQDTLEELGVDVSSVYANSEIEKMDDEMKEKQAAAKRKISEFIESFMA